MCVCFGWCKHVLTSAATPEAITSAIALRVLFQLYFISYLTFSSGREQGEKGKKGEG